MKKIIILFCIFFYSQMAFSQYIIVGQDSISLQDFKKDNLYGLQHSGVDKTLTSIEDFHLLQQFAMEKKADTTASFKKKLIEKDKELREKYFYPRAIIDPIIRDYVSANRIEKEISVFMVEKKPEDKIDYKQVYEDVKSGKITLDNAIQKYMTTPSKPLYIKPGSFDNQIYAEIQKMPNGGYSKFYDMPNFVAFVKLVDSRPSLGYMIFGTLSYPNDANAEKIKTDIYTSLKNGKIFQEVTKLYGSTDEEKNNGGLVLGSPTLPDQVYAALKGKKAGDYTQPILLDNKYYIFNIYNIEPYEINDKNKTFFEQEMMKTQYSELAFNKMVTFIKQSNYKEIPEFNTIKKSYQNLINFKRDELVLFQYNAQKFSVNDLKKLVAEKVKNADKMGSEQWSQLLDMVNSQFVYRAYSIDFPNQKEIKPQIESYKKNLYSEYIFSEYLRKQVDQHPEWLTDYYNKNKTKYIWENRAKGRVAILSDDQLTNEIKKQIGDPNNWDNLQKKYYGQLNDKQKILVNFEGGDMSESAEVFTKYKVPFQKGVYETKMGDRTLVIAIDDILPEKQMTEKESEEYLRDAVTEQLLTKTIAEQRAKTKIIVQPGFINDLEQNFKK